MLIKNFPIRRPFSERVGDCEEADDDFFLFFSAHFVRLENLLNFVRQEVVHF